MKISATAVAVLFAASTWPAGADGGLRNRGRRALKGEGGSEKEGSASPCITRKEMVERIQSFADAVPGISQEFWTNGGGAPGEESEAGCKAARRLSNLALFGAYAYPDRVNFKPTLTSEPYTYRTTRPGALSYFIGTECLQMAGVEGEQFPPGNDGTMFQENGFALNNKNGKTGWVAPTDWDPAKFWFHVDEDGGPYCHTSMAMGKICFTQADGSAPACVDKTFGFIRREDGSVVIVTHHSSAKIAGNSSLTICQDNEFGPAC